MSESDCDSTSFKEIRDGVLDPVHKHVADQLWYFCDETWADCIGPYNTEDEARESLHRYGTYLG